MEFKDTFITNRNGNILFAQYIGNPKNPAILLIMGAMNQGLFWYDSFCNLLAENGFFVIRYDHRDTGFSFNVEYKENPYNLYDLANDAEDIISGFLLSKVHVIGISMGGYIAQLLSSYTNLVSSMTLISTTVDHRPYMDGTMGNFNNSYNLPYPINTYTNFIKQVNEHPPLTDIDFLNSQINGWKILFYNISNDDLDEIIKLIKLSNSRNKNKYSPFNHGLAVLNSNERSELVKKIKVASFIFHGTKDPCFPIEHAIKTNELILNSKLEIIENMGHMFSLTESKILGEKIIKNIKSLT